MRARASWITSTCIYMYIYAVGDWLSNCRGKARAYTIATEKKGCFYVI